MPETHPHQYFGRAGRQGEYPRILFITYFKFITSEFTKICHFEITKQNCCGGALPHPPTLLPLEFPPSANPELVLTPLIQSVWLKNLAELDLAGFLSRGPILHLTEPGLKSDTSLVTWKQHLHVMCKLFECCLVESLFVVRTWNSWTRQLLNSMKQNGEGREHVWCVCDSCEEVASKPRTSHTAKDSKSPLPESASSSSSAQSFAHSLPTASKGQTSASHLHRNLPDIYCEHFCIQRSNCSQFMPYYISSINISLTVQDTRLH